MRLGLLRPTFRTRGYNLTICAMTTISTVASWTGASCISGLEGLFSRQRKTHAMRWYLMIDTSQ